MSETAIAQLHKELIKHGISLDNKQLDNKEFIKYIKKQPVVKLSLEIKGQPLLAIADRNIKLSTSRKQKRLS